MTVALLLVAVLASLGLAVVSRVSGVTAAAARVALALRLLAVVATTVVAGVVAWWAWQEDTGVFTLVLVGVPMAAALLVLGSTLARRPSGAVTWVAAVVLLGWALLTALGAGFLFLGPAVLMVAAAVVSTRGRVQPRPSHGRRRSGG